MIVTSQRRASIDEVASEMDRRGDVITTLETRVAELEHELDASQQRCRWAERELNVFDRANAAHGELLRASVIREESLRAALTAIIGLQGKAASGFPFSENETRDWAVANTAAHAALQLSEGS